MQLVFANNCAARLDDVGCPKKIQYLDLQVVVIGCVLANWRKKKKKKKSSYLGSICSHYTLGIETVLASQIYKTELVGCQTGPLPYN